METDSLPEKNSSMIVYIVLAVFVISTVVFGMMYRDCKRQSTYDPFKDELTKQEIKQIRQQRDSLQEAVNELLARADKAQTKITKSKKNQEKIKQDYVEELNNWRALPDSAMQQRADFIRNELSTVDSIAKR